MKALRYLLIVMMVVLSSVPVKAQFAQEDNMGVQFYSTSPLPGSGSGLPQAAVSGTTFAGDAPVAYAPGRPRRGVGDDEGFEDEEDSCNLPGEPYPIGDGLWVLLLLAAGYAGSVRLRRNVSGTGGIGE